MACLSPEQLHAFLADGLDAEERSAAEEHLSLCRACRHRLVQANEVVRGRDSEVLPEVAVPEELLARARGLGRRAGSSRALPTRSWWPVAAVLALAAVGLVFLRGGNGVGENRAPDGDVLRSGSAEEALELLAPADGAVLDGEILEFRWALPSDASGATFTLLDDLGDILQRSTPSSGRFELDVRNLDPPLPSGSTLYWYLTLRFDDGTTIDTPVRRFRWQLDALGEKKKSSSGDH
ncbi:MAG: zf-HC2 domain-containing protein [Acidobacteria bacterium]|nr:zf-HC2 domain-containing protein [Acidobacteriota bacterium]